MHLRALVTVCLLSSASACRREATDVRVPLGARVVGARHPVLDARGRHTITASSTASLPAATYTAEQAARGAQVYASTCVRCHPPGQLDGPAFAIGWNDARASTLYSLVHNSMPQDRPGSLTDEQYADVIAYLLQRNHAPAGTTPLRPDTAALRQMRISVAAR
jgi:mono/diheme cytochrome c family protein